MSPEMHWLSLLHVVGQTTEVPSHRYGEHAATVVPAGVAVQVPVEQVPQAPQTELQQIPETQLPDWHADPALQVEPLGSPLELEQVPALHVKPVAQLALPEHETGHVGAVPSQT